jgi:hypothetical protein
MLKNPFFRRLRKKVQMQGGARCEARGVLGRTSQRRASAPTPQMGLFQQPARSQRSSGRPVEAFGPLTAMAAHPWKVSGSGNTCPEGSEGVGDQA